MKIKGVWGDQISPKDDSETWQEEQPFQFTGWCLIETEAGRTIKITVEDTDMGFGRLKQKTVVNYEDHEWTIIMDDSSPETETSSEEGGRIFLEVERTTGLRSMYHAMTAAVDAVEFIAKLNHDYGN